MATRHGGGGAYEEVHALDDVEEDLVLPVPDAFCSPGHGVRDGHGRTRLHFEFMRLLRDISSVP